MFTHNALKLTEELCVRLATVNVFRKSPRAAGLTHITTTRGVVEKIEFRNQIMN